MRLLSFFAVLLIGANAMRRHVEPVEQVALFVIMGVGAVPLFVALAIGKVYTACRHLGKYDERVAYLQNKITQVKSSMDMYSEKATTGTERNQID